VLAALLADAILDHAVAVGVLARRVVVHHLRNKKAHPAMVATKRSIQRTIASYTKKQGKARMASDGNLCGDSLRSPEEPPNADDDEFLDDRNEDDWTSSRVRRVLAFLGYGFI
jgi:hypothetical protein